MVPLRKINESLYISSLSSLGYTFILSYGARGVWGAGRAWYLHMSIKGGKKEILTNFITKDDGNDLLKEPRSYKHKLWTDRSEILEEAELIITKIVKMDWN